MMMLMMILKIKTFLLQVNQIENNDQKAKRIKSFKKIMESKFEKNRDFVNTTLWLEQVVGK